MEDAQDLKVKIFFDQQALVIYLRKSITIDTFYVKVRETCKLPSNQPITMKWIDNEDDPCTISSQSELGEAVFLTSEYREAELKLHVFLGMPMSPGAPCPGEDKTVYRRGARRWMKKIYNVQGHRFQPKRLNQRTECALCSDTIWGLGRAGFRCSDCGMCVHKKCHKFVSAKCTMKPMTNNVSGAMLPSDGGAAVVNNNHGYLAQSDPLQPITNQIENKVDSLMFLNPGKMTTEIATTNIITGAVTTTTAVKEPANASKWSMSLEDFDLLTVIGRGSYAKVIQAEYKKTGQIYAIKIIKKTICHDEDDIDWIQTEKSVFEAASNHPFLVGLHSCFQTDSRLFFVIEFIPGGDLMFHMQKQQKLPEDHARFYAAEIILALHFLHSRRIVYRDLKLDNVLLDAEGHIKLTDFGMCKENIGPNDSTSTFCGTPNYIAPEILRGDDYGFSVDFWALGVLMYEMMAGRSPFHLPLTEDQQNTEDYLFQMILERVIRIPRHLSVRAANVLKGFLNKEPTLRLGCKPDIYEGLMDIKMNAFFKVNINWDLLEQRQVPPPYCPNVASERDLQRFDTSFTNEEPTLTLDDPDQVAQIDQSEFEGFDYVNPLIISKEDSV